MDQLQSRDSLQNLNLAVEISELPKKSVEESIQDVAGSAEGKSKATQSKCRAFFSSWGALIWMNLTSIKLWETGQKPGVIRKIPDLTILYWCTKIVSTTLGETCADLISMTLGEGYANSLAIMMSVFVAALIVQFVVPVYIPPIYWATITASALAGTEVSDWMDRTLELGYVKGMSILLGILLGIFLLWGFCIYVWPKGKYRLTKGISFEVTGTMSRLHEVFYWAAILLANCLGTALGDCFDDNAGLGYGYSAVVFGCGIVLTAILALITPVSHVLLFWFWFVLTRPFGAAFGDVLTKPTEKGGLDLGTRTATAILGSMVLALVILESYIVWHYHRKNKRNSNSSTTADVEAPSNQLQQP